jgi:hypothetical protein
MSLDFTPRPWAISIMTPFLVTTADAGDGMVSNIAMVQRKMRGRSKDDHEAIGNARLIASAPTLLADLEALAKRTLEYVGEFAEVGGDEDVLECDAEMRALAKRALATIAAVRGEQ